MEVKVTIENNNQAELIRQWKLNGDLYSENTVTLYLIPSELKLISENGIPYNIVIPDLNEHYKNYWDNRDEYHSFMCAGHPMSQIASA